MKNRAIIIFLILLAAISVFIIIGDFKSTRPDKQGENPFDLNLDEYKDVAPELIKYKEVKNFKLDIKGLAGISYDNGNLYVAGDSSVQVISLEGQLVNNFPLQDEPYCIVANLVKIYVGNENTVSVYSSDGKLLSTLGPFTENSVITSIDTWEENIFIADAGARKVYRFDSDGNKLGEFEGKTGKDAQHGFIIPSPYFDLAVNTFGDLWIVNPGKHMLENYTFEGSLRSFWKASSIKIDGFSGCCNPAHYAFLPDGSFVTSEKGLVRIKVYKPSGEFDGVVAAPKKFKEEGYAPDIAVDDEGNIYALDFDKKMVRVFELKQTGL